MRPRPHNLAPSHPKRPVALSLDEIRPLQGQIQERSCPPPPTPSDLGPIFKTPFSTLYREGGLENAPPPSRHRHLRNWPPGMHLFPFPIHGATRRSSACQVWHGSRTVGPHLMDSFVLRICGRRAHTCNGVTGFCHDRARRVRAHRLCVACYLSAHRSQPQSFGVGSAIGPLGAPTRKFAHIGPRVT